MNGFADADELKIRQRGRFLVFRAFPGCGPCGLDDRLFAPGSKWSIQRRIIGGKPLRGRNGRLIASAGLLSIIRKPMVFVWSNLHGQIEIGFFDFYADYFSGLVAHVFDRCRQGAMRLDGWS